MQLLTNATFHTLDAAAPQVDWLAIEAGRILASGRGTPPSFAGLALTRHDLGGRVVLPGLTDAHLHLQLYARSLTLVDCAGISRAAVLERVAARAAITPPGAWIVGHGWNQNAWPEGFGSAADLDAVAPAHPVYLTAHSLHVGWANSLALRRAGLRADSPDPDGGRLGRDPRGALDGILFEGAMTPLEDALPTPTLAEVTAAIRAAQPHLWALGVTGVHDFDRRLAFQALQRLHQAGELRLRVVQSLPREAISAAAEVGLASGLGDDFLRLGAVKLFSDGALGPHTAAMLQPFEDDPANRGMLLIDAEELFELGRQAGETGLPIAVHAIGDAANHAMLDGFTQLRAWEAAEGRPALRHRIEHVQLLHPADASRLAALGVIASMQPIHATSDMDMAERLWGPRTAHAYGWRTQLDHGARLVFGSDAPVEAPNPFWGLHAAVTRQRRDGRPGPDGWHGAQRLTLGEALHAYTTGPAYAAGMEDRLGRLAPGCLADLIVLPRDPFSLAPDALAELRPEAVMVGGAWVLEG
jgi:predicted amidohydrolase YtcJ